MAKAVKFELNSDGLTELMKSSRMKAALKEYGDSAASQAGEGYTANTVVSGDRAKVFVKASTYKARRDNMENNTLLKSIGGGT